VAQLQLLKYESMNPDELHKLLESGEHLGIVLYAVQLTSEIRLKRIIGICKQSPDAPGLHSWHYLEENPSYVREQKIIQGKPYVIGLTTISDAPELMDLVTIYFAHLDEVGSFLQQFHKNLTDFHKLSYPEYSL
jgi:hypothetical protein